MAKSAPEAKSAAAGKRGNGGKPAVAPAPEATGYFAWSRDAAVSLFAVLPLWLIYEALRLWLSPSERNGAEVLLLGALSRLGPAATLVLRLGLGLAVFVAMRSVQRRAVPWVRVTGVIALEGMVYGLLLGPIAIALATPASHLSTAVPDRQLLLNVVSSLGAGIFEELLFRLVLLSALAWLWLRAVRVFGMPRQIAGIAAVVGSAIAFSWFHHLWGEPYERGVFVFRVMAGVILGFLFWARGYGVCVYTHAMYDLYLYLTQHRP